MKFTPLPDPDANLNLTPLEASLTQKASQAASERPDEFAFRHKNALLSILEETRETYPIHDKDRLFSPETGIRFTPGSVSERHDNARQAYYRAAVYSNEKAAASNQSLRRALKEMEESPWLHPSQMQAAINTLECQSPLRETLYLFVEEMLDKRLKE